MFQEAHVLSFDEAKCTISVSFLKKFMIFQDVLEKEKNSWLLLLKNIYGHNVQLLYNFELVVDQQKQVQQKHAIPSPASVSQVAARIARNNVLDLSDATKWQLAHELLKHFDGVIMEISRDMHE